MRTIIRQASWAVPSGRAPGASHGTWDALLWCLAGFLLTSIGRIHQLFPVLLPLRPALITGVLAVGLWLLDNSPARRVEGQRLPASGWLLALLGWMALSIPGALWQGGAFQTWTGFAKTALMYFLIVSAVRDVRDVERLALVYFVAAVVFSLVVFARFDLGDEGRLGRLYYYDANDFATLTVTAFPLGLYFAFGERLRVFRVAAWGGIGALAVGLVWSGSRGGFLALLAVIGYVLLRFSAIAARWRFITVVIIGLVGAAAASEKYWSIVRTMTHPTEDYNVTSEEGRVQVWRRGLGYMADHPVLGVGAGNFPTAEGTISSLAVRQQWGVGVKWMQPHNSYLQVGAELGVPGLVAFCAFLGSVFVTLRRTAASGTADPASSRLAQALTAALVGFSVGAFFLTLAYHEMLYALAGIAVALGKVSVPRGGVSNPASVAATAARWRTGPAW